MEGKGLNSNIMVIPFHTLKNAFHHALDLKEALICKCDAMVYAQPLTIIMIILLAC